MGLGDRRYNAGMAEPIILSDELIDLAVKWKDIYFAWLRTSDGATIFAETTIISPVDRSSRLTRFLPIRTTAGPAQTVPRLISLTGQHEGPGWTVALDPNQLEPREDFIIAVLLHELTHVVDPAHDRDCATRAANPEPRRPPEEQYAFESEQRAFTAMWSWYLREAVAHCDRIDPREAVNTLASQDRYFGGFLAFAASRSLDLVAQTEEHFSRMVEDLQARKTAITTAGGA
jgi:hypothetical protein